MLPMFSDVLFVCCRSCESQQNDMPEAESPLGHWPHSLSSMMACLGCTLGLFNVSRFAIQSVYFGANFILQFIILSILIGIPLFTLQLCLGQQLGAGVIDMWRISPLFQGVGVALLASQVLMGVYSVIGVSWMFVFFRDSFITKIDRYRWAEPFIYYRDGKFYFISQLCCSEYIGSKSFHLSKNAAGVDLELLNSRSYLNWELIIKENIACKSHWRWNNLLCCIDYELFMPSDTSVVSPLKPFLLHCCSKNNNKDT